MEDKQTQTTPSNDEEQKTAQVANMEDKETQVTPSTTEDKKTVQASTMEDKGIQVTPSTDEDQKTVQTVFMEDKNIQVTPSTDEDQKTVQTVSMEDKETQATLYTDEDQKTVQTVSMEDKETQATPSTDEDQKTVQTVSMVDKETQATPSTDEDQNTVQTVSMEDKETQATPSTDEDQKTVQTVSMEDKETQATPSTDEDQKTVQTVSMVDKETQATPSTDEDQNTVQTVSMEDKETQATPSTDEDQNTLQTVSMEDKETQVTPSSSEHQKTAEATTMEDKETQVTPSIEEDQKTVQTVSMEDKIIQVTPSTYEDQKTVQVVSMEDMIIQVTSSTDEDQKTVQAAAMEDKSPIGSTNHEMASPVPCASAIKDQSCVLSFEKMTCYRMLGEGCYGMVLLATHPATDQKLAVKIVQKKKLLQNAGDCEMIFTERDLLKAASESPFITHLFGTFQTKDHLVFVMECLSRGDLFDTVVSGPFFEDTIRYFIAEMICALQFLHSREIVHRDIKPENILLSDGGHIKITDFGLSVAGVTESKRIKERIGTPTFMAPEVLQGFPYFGMADYYALGIIVYVMAVGGHPYLRGTESLMETLEKVTTKEPRYPEDMNPTLRGIIEIFLCKDQEERMMLARGIRGHPFLWNVDWKETEQGKSPPPFPSGYIPEEDLSIGMPGNEFIQFEEGRETLIEPEEQKKFYGFTYGSECLKPQPVASSP